jgi:hypothetical protein
MRRLTSTLPRQSIVGNEKDQSDALLALECRAVDHAVLIGVGRYLCRLANEIQLGSTSPREYQRLTETDAWHGQESASRQTRTNLGKLIMQRGALVHSPGPISLHCRWRDVLIARRVWLHGSCISGTARMVIGYLLHPVGGDATFLDSSTTVWPTSCLEHFLVKLPRLRSSALSLCTDAEALVLLSSR